MAKKTHFQFLTCTTSILTGFIGQLFSAQIFSSQQILMQQGSWLLVQYVLKSFKAAIFINIFFGLYCFVHCKKI